MDRADKYCGGSVAFDRLVCYTVFPAQIRL